MFKFEIQILLNICNLAHNFKFFRNLKFRQILRSIRNKHGVYIVKPPCLGLAEVYLRYYTETQWDIRNPFIQKAFSYLNCHIGIFQSGHLDQDVHSPGPISGGYHAYPGQLIGQVHGEASRCILISQLAHPGEVTEEGHLVDIDWCFLLLEWNNWKKYLDQNIVTVHKYSQQNIRVCWRSSNPRQPSAKQLRLWVTFFVFY